MAKPKKPFKAFGDKLSKALVLMADESSQSLTVVQQYIGEELGKSVGTIERWRQGVRLPDTDKLELLVKILISPREYITEIKLEPPDLTRLWFEEFLELGQYRKPIEDLLNDLFQYIPPDEETEDDFLQYKRPDEPPNPDADLVGRGKELFALQNKLKTDNFVILTGMPGIGKTVLASTLYKTRPPERRFWHSLGSLAGFSNLVYKLANHLACHGDSTILAQWYHNKASDLSMLEQIIYKISGKEYLICLDNLNNINGSEKVKQILEPLLQGAKRDDFDLLIVSRERPLIKIDGIDMKPFVVEGLNEDETEQLLAQLNQSSSEGTQAISHQITRGNPQFLILMADILNQQKQVIDEIIEIGEDPNLDLEIYIMEEVDKYLNENERNVMYALSICMEDPSPYSLIEEIADQGNLFTALTNLRRRHLLLLYKDANEVRYSQHAIIQKFYYERISRREQKAMHARAAAYYRNEEQDAFKAALHYVKAEAFEQAAEYLIDNTLPLIYQGQAQGANQLLNSIENKISVDEDFLSRMLLSQGTFLRIQGEYESAIQTFTTGFEQARSPVEQIEFLNEMTRMHRYQGAFDKALQTIEQIQGIYEHNPTLLMEPKILNNMGWVYYRLGNIEAAEQYFTLAWGNDGEGLALTVMANTLLGLGTVANIQEQIDVAIQHFSKAQSLFEQRGDPIGLAQSSNNLGIAYINMQQFEDALEYLEVALDTFETIGDANMCIIIAYNIATVYMYQKKYGAADACLEEMYPLAQRVQNYPLLCRFAASRSEIALHQNRLTQAKEHLAMAQQWVEKATSDAEQGIVYYISGIIAITEGKHEQALELMESAIPLLEKSHDKDYLVLAQDALNSLSS